MTSTRETVKRLALQGLAPREIARVGKLTPGQVAGWVRRLRLAGELPGDVKPAPPRVATPRPPKGAITTWTESALTERWADRKLRRAREALSSRSNSGTPDHVQHPLP